MKFLPGQRVKHKEYLNGIVIHSVEENYVKVFFHDGERSIPEDSLELLQSPSEQIISNIRQEPNRLEKIYLSYLAHLIQISENTIALTSAKIDLLPHQIVLTHKVATSFPRRFLIADEVGLGKTIETAMILRELSSRGELDRALMVVPAGLVNNWHRELNEVFQLNFEVFGSEGDVTDRKSNAFQKHNLLIASIDTLKKSERVKKIKNAQKWDIVVFDEGHHLTAYKSGNKVKKTDNYKLAEVLKDHSRDLIILSATPHQGDHFRFWMIVQLLNSSLFKNPDEMLLEKHRLNQVIIRRTKADACKPNGDTLFARRMVSTDSLSMTVSEKTFYLKLKEYLEDGFDLAKQKGNQGRALGFVMAIFQKIASSSFAAVRRTLNRRLISITIQEIINYEAHREISKRDNSYNEAIELVRKEYKFDNSILGNTESEKIVFDLKRRILKKTQKELLEEMDGLESSEVSAIGLEEDILSLTQLMLPEEKNRINELLAEFPIEMETKSVHLVYALKKLWNTNPNEKIVVFATYLGTVEMLENTIRKEFPDQGVVILKGGDHGAKLSAENKFKKRPGPNLMICTAAGREGINLQHARILFNFDLPWNPMDLEQRIGRIHRYGQIDTAQIYNLVLSDTIEGKIFLLLENKLKEIAKALGKVDNNGQITENFESQILGQLSEKINYEELYRNALSDQELKRTAQELEVAILNAKEAREVVFELFQDLDKFHIEDYKKISNTQKEVETLLEFLKIAIQMDGNSFETIHSSVFKIVHSNNETLVVTTNREESIQNSEMELIGIDHPLVIKFIEKYKSLAPQELGVLISSSEIQETLFCSIWHIDIKNEKGEKWNYILPIVIDDKFKRYDSFESNLPKIFLIKPKQIDPIFSKSNNEILNKIETIVEREIHYRGWVNDKQNYHTKLIGWIEFQNNQIDKTIDSIDHRKV